MRRLVYLLGAALTAGALAAPVAAQAPADDRAPVGDQAPVAAQEPAQEAAQEPAQDKPFPGNQADVFLYVDTVNSPRPPANKPRPKACTQLSAFKRGERIVFRVWGVESGTGDVLTTENVKYAYVKIPGQPNVKLNFGPHGSGTGRSTFWTAGWSVPLDYPLGVLAYRIVFKTESGKFGIFTQDGLPQESLLTILPQ